MRHFLKSTGWLTLFLMNASYALEQSRVDRCLLQVEVQFLENPAMTSRQEKHAWKKISETSCARTGAFTTPEAFVKGSDTAYPLPTEAMSRPEKCHLWVRIRYNHMQKHGSTEKTEEWRQAADQKCDKDGRFMDIRSYQRRKEEAMHPVPTEAKPLPKTPKSTPTPTSAPIQPIPAIPAPSPVQPPVQTGNIYHPRVGVTWQWQLKGNINTNYPVELYDVDLVDTPISTIQLLQSQNKKVICYFSAGSSEDWRPDFSKFQPTDKGTPLSGWAGENWLDIRSNNVRAIMQSRLDLAKQKGCDGVEPDNVDGYTNKPGFPLTATDQINYNIFLANEAHRRNLAIALKNDVDQVAELASYFDFAVNEQCFEFNECDNLKTFIAQNKPVLNAEYKVGNTTTLCSQSTALQFSTLVLPLELDDKSRFSCLK